MSIYYFTGVNTMGQASPPSPPSKDSLPAAAVGAVAGGYACTAPMSEVEGGKPPAQVSRLHQLRFVGVEASAVNCLVPDQTPKR